MQHTIFHIWLTDKLTLGIEASYLILFVIFLIFLISIGLWWIFKKLTTHDVELLINFGNVINIKITPNNEVVQIAHQAWAELMTRKAGLRFEKEHDVIIEIYNSWYALFGEIRFLIKNIPANQIKNENVKKLVQILIDSLNIGLRPHLTKWQAKFRKWYENETRKDESFNISPQEIQKKYPEYDVLIDDLLNVNEKFVKYTKELEKLFK